mmetsp:Transcript_30969/g.98867  ORF Transcript_30969/g.98867 Transcript_30969/m.98867 type:complete len:230 (+) Transcript_30969:286-975(+)
MRMSPVVGYRAAYKDIVPSNSTPPTAAVHPIPCRPPIRWLVPDRFPSSWPGHPPPAPFGPRNMTSSTHLCLQTRLRERYPRRHVVGGPPHSPRLDGQQCRARSSEEGHSGAAQAHARPEDRPPVLVEQDVELGARHRRGRGAPDGRGGVHGPGASGQLGPARGASVGAQIGRHGSVRELTGWRPPPLHPPPLGIGGSARGWSGAGGASGVLALLSRGAAPDRGVGGWRC